MNAAPENLTHAQEHQWIEQSLDAPLDGRQQIRLDRHLAGCPACAAYLETYRDLHSQLKRALPARWPEPAYSPATLNRKLTGLHRRTRRTAMHNTFTSLARLAAAAALLIGLVFGLAYLVQSLNLQPALPGGDLTATHAAQPTMVPATPTSMPGAPTDLSEEEQQVRMWVFEYQPDMNPSVTFPLIEITTLQMREKIDARVFKVTGDVWQNEAFLIWNSHVYKLSTAFGDSGIEQVFITDLDGNGAPELAYNSHFGSGVTNTMIGLFVFEGPGHLLEARIEGSIMNRLGLTQVDEQTVLVQNRLPGADAGRTWRLALVDNLLRLEEQSSSAQTYTVQLGDTCAAIAAAHDISVEQLIALNDLSKNCVISVGQVLNLSQAADGPIRSGGLIRLEAQVRVQNWLQTSYASDTPVDMPLNELTTDEIWQRLGTQVFQVVDGIFAGETYLTQGDTVTRILTTPGRRTEFDLFVTDLDGNGRLELLVIDRLGGQQPQAWLLEQAVEGFDTKAHSYFTNVSLKKISDEQVETYRVDGPGYQLTGRLALQDDWLVLAPLDETTRLNTVPDWGLSFQVPTDWQSANGADGATRLEGADGYIELPASLQSGDLQRACELALNTNPGGIFGGKSSASVIEVASRTICFINKTISNDGQKNNEVWLYLPVGESNQYALIMVDHLHLGLLLNSLTYHNDSGLGSGSSEPVTLSIEPSPSGPVLAAYTMGDLTLEEWRLVLASVDTPGHTEFNQRIPAEVKARRAAWRDTTLADGIAANNRLLEPFGYRLKDQTPDNGPSSITLYQGEQPLLERLEMAYPASVYHNEQGQGDFALVVIDAQSQGWLVRTSGVTAYDLGVSQYTRPVFAGQRLISLESYYGEDTRLHLSVRQDGSEIYQYRPLGSGASEPVQGLSSWDGHWVLEINGFLIVDGVIWNEKDFPAGEIFNWHMLNGKPLFFFTRAGQTGIWYDGRELPVTYDRVVHYRCCESAIFNPGGSDLMIWFYAQRDGYWYYVELGKFD